MRENTLRVSAFLRESVSTCSRDGRTTILAERASPTFPRVEVALRAAGGAAVIALIVLSRYVAKGDFADTRAPKFNFGARENTLRVSGVSAGVCFNVQPGRPHHNSQAGQPAREIGRRFAFEYEDELAG
ncbi:MAG TPA: hypothetical protein VGH90_10880 [Chthoniobacteraceae bacterium]